MESIVRVRRQNKKLERGGGDVDLQETGKKAGMGTKRKEKTREHEEKWKGEETDGTVPPT